MADNNQAGDQQVAQPRPQNDNHAGGLVVDQPRPQSPMRYAPAQLEAGLATMPRRGIHFDCYYPDYPDCHDCRACPTCPAFPACPTSDTWRGLLFLSVIIVGAAAPVTLILALYYSGVTGHRQT